MQTQATAMISDSESWPSVLFEALYAVSLEMFVFLAAVIAYFVAYGSPFRSKKRMSDTDVVQLPVDRCAKELEVAGTKGDYRLVLKYWSAIKKCGEPVTLNLGYVVAGLQKFRHDTSFIISEVSTWFQKHPGSYGIDEFNNLIDALGRRVDSELVEQLVKVLPLLNLRMNSRTCEILMQLHFMLRDLERVQQVEKTMESMNLQKTPRVWIVLLKTGLKRGDLEYCLTALRQALELWEDPESANASGLDVLLTQVAMLGAKEHRTAQVVHEFQKLPSIPMDTMNVLLPACLAEHREDLVSQLVQFLKTQGSVPDAETSACLIKALVKHDPQGAKKHVLDAMERDETQWTADLVQAMLAVCMKNNDTDLALKLHAHVKTKSSYTLQVRLAWMRGFGEMDLADEACDIFQDDIVQRGLKIGANQEKVLLSLAMRCAREDLSNALMAASNAADTGRQVSMIRQCAQEGNLAGAQTIYDSMSERGEANTLLSNALLDAMVCCGALEKAEQWMDKAGKSGLVDVVSYNTLLKAYIALGTQSGFQKAMSVLRGMPAQKVKPNAVTYNEILNALVDRKGKDAQTQLSKLIDEMAEGGIEPNHVTASILLKGLGKRSSDADVRKAMDMVAKLDEGMDEVLVSSIIEACVRVEKPQMLRDYLTHRVPNSIGIFGAHTFGSLIKAYGYVGDMNAVWRCWKEMRNRHITPTPITLGCMVEAVVSNGDTEGAYELIQSMEQDEMCQHHLNSVVYCSVLKGFAREKRLDRVLQVFDDMKERKVVFSIAAFNATIDACARANRMDKLPWLEEEMKVQNVTPNIVSYSTMIKGYAASGDMAKAFSLFEVIQSSDMVPDEIVYNSLIDGCARGEDYDRGLEVLADMKAKHISPSNFTLSVIIKLCCRCKKLDQAFKFKEDWSKELGLRPNDHVYANLIQACVYCRSQGRALQVFEEQLERGIRPLPRVYALLIRSAVQSNQPGLVKGLIELAVGVRRDLPTGRVLDNGLAEAALDPSMLSEALQRLASAGSEEVADQIFCVVRHKVNGVRLDRKLAKQFLSKVPRPTEVRNRGQMRDRRGYGES
jgi:pentatricopeptide repeat protein